MATYFDGAVMAYRDCAEFTQKMLGNLETSGNFEGKENVREIMTMIRNGFYEKANAVIIEVQEATKDVKKL